MPFVTCPTCGERGKITSNLIGVRIKCRKCGVGFLVQPPAPAGKPAAASVAATSSTGPSAAVEAHGIEVEGLDASSWVLPTETAAAIAATRPVADVAGAGAGFETGAPPSGAGAAREYKLLTSRDKYFDGKFDLVRLEDALNHFARLGWVAKSMLVPHLKGYSGAMEEVIVVLLERCREAR